MVKAQRKWAEEIETYSTDVDQWSVPSKQEELELGRRAEAGDEAAQRELVERNLRLVIYWAKRKSCGRVSLEDLVQEGNLGLMQAAQKFRVGMGASFGTYATWWIQQAIQRAQDKSDLIRVPIHLQQEIRRGDIVGDRREEINLLRGVVSLEAPLHTSSFGEEGEELLLGDALVDDRADVEAAVRHRELREQVERLLARLPKRMQVVLRMRFGIGTPVATLDEVAEKVGMLSRQRVQQLEVEALGKLRRMEMRDGG